MSKRSSYDMSKCNKILANINPCKNNVYITCPFNRISTVATAA